MEKPKYIYFFKALALLAFAVAAVWGVRGYVHSLPSAASFSVSGEGKVVAVPDIATFTFTVLTEGGKDFAALQMQNTTAANKAIEFVKGKGVKAEDIRTEQYSIEPRYEYVTCDYRLSVPCRPATIIGYTVTNTVSVKIRDFATIGDLLTGVVQNGANTVSGVNFTIDDPAALENEARALALVEAREKAKAIAKAGGFKVGRVLAVSEGFNYPFYAKFETAAYGMGGDTAIPAPAPAIEPGSQDVVVNVTLQYEIR